MNRGRDSKVGDKVTCRHKVHNLQIVYVLLSPVTLFFLSSRLLSPHFVHPSPCSFCYSVSFSLTLCSPVTLFFLLFCLLLPHILFTRHPVLSAIPSPFSLHFFHPSPCLSAIPSPFPHTSFTRHPVLSFCLVLLPPHSFIQKKCQKPQGFWHFLINAVGIIIAWI